MSFVDHVHTNKWELFSDMSKEVLIEVKGVFLKEVKEPGWKDKYLDNYVGI